MFNDLKIKVEKTKRFVEENKMLVACSVSALIASKLTYDMTVSHCMEKFAEYVENSENTINVLALQNIVAIDFINQKNLGDELHEFVLKTITVEK